MAIGGRDIYDAAVTLRKHHAQFVLHTQQCAENVGVESRRVALGGLLRHRTGLAFGAGGVNSHIQGTEARHRLIDQVSYVVLVSYIGFHVFRLRVESAEFSHQILAGFVASARDNDARALFREGKGGGSSDAREGAGDQNNGDIHSELLGGQFVDQLEPCVQIWTYVRLIPVKRSLTMAKPTQLRPLIETRNAGY